MTPPQTRITFVIGNLACGGIQCVTVWLAQGLMARGYQVSVITLATPDADFFHLPPGITRLSVGLRGREPSGLWRLPSLMVKRQKRLRALIESTAPDVVIARAPMAAVQTALAMGRRRWPLIVTEHGDKPLRQKSRPREAWRKWLWYKLRRVVYWRATRLVSVCAAVDEAFVWMPAERRVVIHNPCRTGASGATTDPSPDLDAEHHWIVSTGRLSYAKGYDVLLEAFASVADLFPDWELVILGDGELRDELIQRAWRLNLHSRVVFAGAVEDPAPFLARAELFALASRYEGFPNAHIEALSLGVPVVATDCPTRPSSSVRIGPARGGVHELVEHGVTGLLVPPEDPAAFAAALGKLLGDKKMRDKMAANAVRVREKFAPEKTLDAWEKVIAGAIGRHAPPQRSLVAPS
jgi:GalNAc-alpha-(1->4)-GalNAc-alpha-(1->3)-diNAcBac-PP-undecaprenol alpha-1,4-N-acetyl-D-galactosaminyltransferase